MTNNLNPFFIRLPIVINLLGISRTTIYNRINQNLLCPPISLGPRTAGFVYSEVKAVINAMIGGKSESEIKELVSFLVSQRKSKDLLSA